MRNGLTQRQETFCLKYFELGNATEAALIAGYSPRSIRNIASVNLTKANITGRLEELRKKAEDASVASVLERKQVLTEITRTVPSQVMDIAIGGRDTEIKPEALNSHAVSYIRTEQLAHPGMPVRITRVGLVDKVKAIDLLNKMESIYSDQPQVNVDNRKIEIYVISEKGKELTARITAGEGTQK